MSLTGANPPPTHTISVRKGEANATGGLVGAGARRYADGGAVAPAFPRMSGGSVPGSGHHDTVPRTLDAGAFVIRKAAVQKYGGGALSRLANGVARFAVGGRVMAFGNGRSQGTDPDGKPIVPKKNREAVEALKMIDLGLQGMNEYTGWLQWNYGASVSLDMRSKTMESYGKQAQQDRRALEDFISRKTLTGNERQNLERIKQTWRQAMAQPLLWGKDLERELIDYMEQNLGEF
jgi:phage-related minor tail protein